MPRGGAQRRRRRDFLDLAGSMRVLGANPNVARGDMTCCTRANRAAQALAGLATRATIKSNRRGRQSDPTTTVPCVSRGTVVAKSNGN